MTISIQRLFSAFVIGSVLAITGLSLANADEKEANTCMETKIFDGYQDGWAVRTATASTLAQGEHRVYLLTLYAGNEYKLEACGDKGVKDLDLILHDVEGNELLRDDLINREPSLTYKPSETQTFYIAVYASDLTESKGGVAVAVVAVVLWLVRFGCVLPCEAEVAWTASAACRWGASGPHTLLLGEIDAAVGELSGTTRCFYGKRSLPLGRTITRHLLRLALLLEPIKTPRSPRRL